MCTFLCSSLHEQRLNRPTNVGLGPSQSRNRTPHVFFFFVFCPPSDWLPVLERKRATAMTLLATNHPPTDTFCLVSPLRQLLLVTLTNISISIPERKREHCRNYWNSFTHFFPFSTLLIAFQDQAFICFKKGITFSSENIRTYLKLSIKQVSHLRL